MNDAVPASATFRAARDLLLQHRTDYAAAVRDFRWPEFDRFNWALDWFDEIARANDRPALVIVEEDGSETRRSFAETLLRFCYERMPAYSRVRRLEFAELPKTISGKIRRVELREREQHLHGGADRSSIEFREDDFPDLKKGGV